MFEPKVATESKLRSSSFLDAQPWCNFIVFEPIQLPKGMSITEQQLRPESPSARSSYRCVVKGQNRTLSIKQFLYDWAPPAYDHPSLWRNHKISKQSDTPIPRPFLLNDDVAWIGLNFRREQGLSLNLKRTMIEMTAIEGTFTDAELLAICHGLNPVSTVEMHRILSTPFAHLCYCNRHQDFASEVPLSYWKYNRDKTCRMKGNSNGKHKPPITIPASYGYVLNSIFTFDSKETEYYFEHRDLPGSYVRLLVSESMPFPPKSGDQYFHQEAYHAYLTEEFGAHEVVLRHGILMLIKPAAWTSKAWVRNLLDDIR